MWLFVFFDLPTNTKKERRTAQQFRKKLLKDGFTMMQYSVYTRHCASFESATVHIKRIKSFYSKCGTSQHFKNHRQAIWRHSKFLGNCRKPSSEFTTTIRIILITK